MPDKGHPCTRTFPQRFDHCLISVLGLTPESTSGGACGWSIPQFRACGWEFRDEVRLPSNFDLGSRVCGPEGLQGPQILATQDSRTARSIGDAVKFLASMVLAALVQLGEMRSPNACCVECTTDSVEVSSEVHKASPLWTPQMSVRFNSPNFRPYIGRAGTPTTVAPGGTSSVTTAPAPTRAPAPIETPSRTLAPVPIKTPAPSSTPPDSVAPGLTTQQAPTRAS